MTDIKLLDCTLRDGGYYTNWNFDTLLVRSLVNNLDHAGIDVIELGYKSPVKGGKYRKCNDKFIWEVLDYKLPEFAKLAYMIDAKDFIKNNNINYSLIDDVIHDKINSPFSICRLAIKLDELTCALEIARYIKSKGYDLIVNLMGISLLTDDQIQLFGQFSKLNPLALYFADSYGNLEPSDVIRIINIFKQFNCPIGIHTHDNLGLAFANCITALNENVNWIDGTLMGMGRGVGNVKTEQLVTYFQYKHGKYKSNPVQEIISKYIDDLHIKYNWGFTHNYMISGIKHIHPLYSQDLQATYLSSTKIQDILLDIDNPSSYDPNKIRKFLHPKVAVVIPARYKSSRFPGKPLAKINNKEMIIHVAEIAEKAVGKDNVFIATENEEIVSIVKQYGYQVILTSDDCLTGTDRVAEASKEIEADIFINVQGDEPMIDYKDILNVIELKKEYPEYVINCMTDLCYDESPEDKKIPKIICDLNNNLLYSSRNVIPGNKQKNSSKILKQVCIYAFNRDHLDKFYSNSKTPLEYQEDIEIVRFLEKGIPVKMLKVENQSYAVDYPNDIKIIENKINK